MSSKNNLPKEEIKLQSKMDELQVTNRLDLSITKDDLLDIIIDKELTSLENQIKDLELEKDKIQDERQKEKDKIKKSREKVLDKYISKDLKVYLSTLKSRIAIEYSEYYKRINIEVRNLETDEIELNIELKKIHIFNLPPYDNPKMKEFDKQISIIDGEISKIKSEIEKINKMGKRIKSKLLVSFLQKSKEGKGILDTLKNSEIKLLS